MRIELSPSATVPNVESGPMYKYPFEPFERFNVATSEYFLRGSGAAR